MNEPDFSDIERKLRLAKQDPKLRALAEKVERRLYRIRSAKDHKAFMQRLASAGVAQHDLGCMCPGCQKFWEGAGAG